MADQYVGALRVWWIPQLPGEPFRVRVPTLTAARLVVHALADYDLFMLEHGVRGDFSNTGGLEECLVADAANAADDEWAGYETDDGDEFEELTDSQLEILDRKRETP